MLASGPHAAANHLQGVMMYSDGTVYEGGWKNDERTGFAVVCLPNGDTVEGVWKADKISRCVACDLCVELF